MGKMIDAQSIEGDALRFVFFQSIVWRAWWEYWFT